MGGLAEAGNKMLIGQAMHGLPNTATINGLQTAPFCLWFLEFCQCPDTIQIKKGHLRSTLQASPYM